MRLARRNPTETLGWLSALVALGASLTWFGGFLADRWHYYVIDDAFITFRYADNWVDGYGPVWNSRGDPVEGYSTPLFMTALAVGHGLTGVSLHILGKAYCALSFLGVVAASAYVVHRTTARPWMAVLACAAILADPAVAIWTVGAMEAMPYAFCFAASLVAFLRLHHEAGRWDIIALIASLSCMALVRTEGAIGVAAILPPLFFARPKTISFRQALLLVGVPALITALHFLLRRFYYGLWMPLPFYSKLAGFAGQGLVTQFFIDHWPFWLLGAVVLFSARRSMYVPLLGYALAFAALLSLAAANADPIMAHWHRYLLPIVPLLVILAVLGFDELLDRGTPFVVLAPAFVLIAVAYGPRTLGGNRKEWFDLLDLSQPTYERGAASLGRFLQEHVDTPNVTIANADCGIIPFHTSAQIIDLHGLNDPQLAFKRDDVDYVLAQAPEFAVLRYVGFDQVVADDPRFKQRYEFLHEWNSGYHLARYRLFRRKGVDLLTDIYPSRN